MPPASDDRRADRGPGQLRSTFASRDPEAAVIVAWAQKCIADMIRVKD
jgi:hypothetical protein